MSFFPELHELSAYLRDNPLQAQVTREWVRREAERAAEDTSGLFFCVVLGCRFTKGGNSLALCVWHREEHGDVRDLNKAIRKHEAARAWAGFRARVALDTAIREDERRQADEKAVGRPARRYTGPPRRGYVYRLRAASGRLLYVGKTYSVRTRLFGGPSSHSQTKPWWPDVAAVEVAVYRTEAAALEAERWAIQRENPLHNIDRLRPSSKRSPACLHRYSGAL